MVPSFAAMQVIQGNERFRNTSRCEPEQSLGKRDLRQLVCKELHVSWRRKCFES